jgi:hypothetical protein
LQGQLDRLLAVASLPNIELGVIPTSVQLPFPAMQGLWIYDDKLVSVNTVSAELVLKDGIISTYIRGAGVGGLGGSHSER